MDLDVSADSLLLLSDHQTELLPPLLSSQSGDVASSHSTTEIALPTCKVQMQTMSYLPDCVKDTTMSLSDETTGPLPAISNALSQDIISHVDTLAPGEPVPPSKDLTGCVSLCSDHKINTEPVADVFEATQASGIGVNKYIDSAEPILPLFYKPPQPSPSLTSTHFESFSLPFKSFSDIKAGYRSAVSSSFIRDSRPADAHRDTSPVLVSSKEKSSTEPALYHSSSLPQSNKPPYPDRPSSDLLENLDEINTVTETTSDLYIFESGTREFILSPQNVAFDSHPNQYTDHPSSPQAEGHGTDLEQDKNVLTFSHDDSSETETQSQQEVKGREDLGKVELESEMGQYIKPGTPTLSAHEGCLMSISDTKAEVSGSSPQTRQSDSPNELWLDACQYLSGERKGKIEDSVQTIVDERENSTVEGGVWATSDTSCFLGHTKVSGCHPEEEDRISWSSSDMGSWGQPVERWSSVDSWASALSDWAMIITAPPEDFTTAFTEIGAEIDALTQALANVQTDIDTKRETPDLTHTLSETPTGGQDREKSQAEEEVQTHLLPLSQAQTAMAIQDQELEPKPSPLSSTQQGQSCLTSSLTKPELSPLTEQWDREDTQTEDSHISVTTMHRDKEPGETGRSNEDVLSTCLGKTHPSLGSSSVMLGSPEGYSVDKTDVPGSVPCGLMGDLVTESLHLEDYVWGVDADIYLSHKADPVVLHITEDTDEGLERQEVITEIKTKEPFKDGVCKVTEKSSVLQQGLATQKEGERSYGSVLSVSGFSKSEATTPEADSEHAEESKPLTDLYFSNTYTPETHVPFVDTPPGRLTNACKHVSFHTLQELDKAQQGEPQHGSPHFIMPLAPCSIGPPLSCPINNTLEGDQVCPKRFLNDIKGHSCACKQSHVPQPTFEGITCKSPLEVHTEKQLINKKDDTTRSAEKSSLDEQKEEQTICSSLCQSKGLSNFELQSKDNTQHFLSDRKTSTITQEISNIGKELSNLVTVSGDNFVVSQKDRVACVTLDFNELFTFRATGHIAARLYSDLASNQIQLDQKKTSKMPHKTHKSTSECKARSKKDKSIVYHHTTQPSKMQENPSHHLSVQRAPTVQDNHPPMDGNQTKPVSVTRTEGEKAGLLAVIETEKLTSKPHGKKKKKHAQNVAVVKSELEPLTEVENGAKQKTVKGKSGVFESKLDTKASKTKDKATGVPNKDSVQSESAPNKPLQPEANICHGAEAPYGLQTKPHQPTNLTSQLKDDVVKRRRLSEGKFGKMVSYMESNVAKPEGSHQEKREEPKTGVETTRKKAYSEVVKQKTHKPKEDPKVVQPIQVSSVSGDPQSLSLWCQFTVVFTDYTVTWSREGTTLAEIKRSAGDESRVSLTITKASHKDLGKYQCRLSSPHGLVTLDYLLTYEVLSEVVIPASPKNIQALPVEVVGEEEDVRCSRLMFRDDFIAEQFFGENQSASIITEKVHFGEGMHRRAFRTKLQAGLVPLFSPGHPCVLKVHNVISCGTKNNEELIQKNFNLAVEECQVQNTARQYIKAYTSVAQSTEAFGDVPEIIPIFLVHRPSNDIPYATLEEELIGDFVKYSVKDGKEINLMRCDSEAGQKCCAFQHWVYHNTDGNLLVTDMQGVGMRLTDVGIATCKKGYKGFRGNCATSFIDQFKALHQCNKYCEMLDLKSLQPKPKKPVSAPKPKPQPSATPKKKTFGPTVKGKS